MAENNRKTLYLQGKLYWFKALGSPRPNYDGDAREWTFEFEPDAASIAQMSEAGIEDKLRDRSDKKGYEDRGKFIILKRSEFKKDGTPNEKIRVVDAANQAWSDRTNVGNASEADVKVTVVDYGPRKKKGVYPQAVRVTTLVPYEVEEFPPLEKDDPRRVIAEKKADTFKKDFGLEDDEPTDEPKADTEAPQDELDDDLPIE